MRIKGLVTEELFDGYKITCDIIRMGKDYTLCVYGGDTPHAGAVVMSVARPSLTGNGTGVTSSVLTGMGHKDDMVAKWFAEEIARKENCTVVCSCGIHVDNITTEQIKIVTEKSSILLRKIEEEIENI